MLLLKPDGDLKAQIMRPGSLKPWTKNTSMVFRP